MLSLLTFGCILLGCVSSQYWNRFDCPWRRVYLPGYVSPYPAPPVPINPYNPSGARLCSDLRVECPIWASTGQCASNPPLMQRFCGRSCGTCGFGGGLPPPAVATIPRPALYVGRSIYETGILRKTNIHPLSESNRLADAPASRRT